SANWSSGEPCNGGAHATYHYAGGFDDTDGANIALVEYDGHSAAAADTNVASWKAYSAFASGTVTLGFATPPAPTGPFVPWQPKKPGPVDPHKNGVSKLLEADKHIVYFVGDNKGNFNPTTGITRAETAQIFYNLLKNKEVGAAAAFTDVKPTAWYADAVNTLAKLGMIEGRGKGIFAPEENISRAEFTVIALRFAEAITGTVDFSDVPANYWAHHAISGAAQYGWIMGYEDGTFRPQEDIQRSEAAKIVNTMLWRFPDSKYIDSHKDLKTFPDVAQDNWAFYEVAEATNAHDFTADKNGKETWKK
ncbi:MAG: S-layer homology domain-containing protein, partial [Pseudoflavonifractor sp.]